MGVTVTDPVEQLFSQARAGSEEAFYDLVVIGSPPLARAPVRGASVTQMVVRHAGCSILVVPAGAG